MIWRHYYDLFSQLNKSTGCGYFDSLTIPNQFTGMTFNLLAFNSVIENANGKAYY